jgi:hypothetical protein
MPLKKELQTLAARRKRLEEEGLLLLSRMDKEEEQLNDIKAKKLGIKATDVLEVFRPTATDKRIPENVYRLNGREIREIKFDEIFQFFPVILNKNYGKGGIVTLCGRKKLVKVV